MPDYVPPPELPVPAPAPTPRDVAIPKKHGKRKRGWKQDAHVAGAIQPATPAQADPPPAASFEFQPPADDPEPPRVVDGG